MLAQWRRSLRVYWYRTDRAAWVLAAAFALVVVLLGFGLRAVFVLHEERQSRTREFHTKHLDCLARNVYFEARGEPVAGQYAVAEVTMNRKASRRYPKTVCEVVYQQNWDPLRKRYVGAFSWTEFDVLPEPSGPEWQRAWKIAETVYYRRHTPTVRGALFFHAVHIKPDWAKEKRRVARIGRHVFYR